MLCADLCQSSPVVKREKRDKLKLAVTLFLSGKDTEFHDLLQRIDFLSNEAGLQSIAETLHLAQSTHGNVITLIERDDRRNAEEKMRKSIMDALNITEQDLYWKTAYDNCQDRVQDTGGWLLADTSFHLWSSAKSVAAPQVLALEAPDSHGKTYLCSKIMEELRPNYLTHAETTSTHMAYVFCNSNRKSGKTLSVRAAIAALIWQLIENDQSFLKFVADVCGTKRLSDDPVTLWTDTFVRYGERRTKAETTYFLILDGVNHIKENLANSLRPIVRKVANQQGGVLRIKLLMSGDEQSLNEVGPLIRAQCIRIKVPERNRKDREAFIKRKLDENKWPQDGKLDQSRHRIEQDLLVKSQDFRILDGILTQIKGLESFKKITEVIQEESNITSSISKLNGSLDSVHLEEFNEILPWIVLPDYWMKVDQIVAVLAIKRGEDIDVRYEHHLRKTYPSPLLEIKDKDVMSFGTLEFFSKVENQAFPPQDHLLPYKNSKAVAQSRQIHDSEVLIVNNMIRHVCGPELYNRFGFREFFQAKQSPRKGARIMYNEVDGHLRITVSCLKALGYGSDKNAKALHNYAVEELPRHLNSLASADLGGADRNRKNELGTHLHCLLSEDAYLKTWLSPEVSGRVCEVWLHDDSTVHSILRLLEDRDVRRGISTDASEWDEPSATCTLYEKATRYMVEQWLGADDWDVASAFEWVQAYYLKVSSNDLQVFV